MLTAWSTVSGNRLYTTSFLVSVAGLAMVREQAQRGLRLFGAVHAWLETMGIPVPWMQGIYYQPDIETVRATLGEEASARAWAEGQAMTLEQAVEYALKDEAEE